MSRPVKEDSSYGILTSHDERIREVERKLSGEAAGVGSISQSWTIGPRAILDTGIPNQARAGRVLTLADFTDLGLAAPIALWNLTDLTDVSGNNRPLTNKGAVTFGKGITGATTEAAQFTGSTAQALYRNDEAALSFKTGSWGCWFRTGKRGVTQNLMSKLLAAGGQRGFGLTVDSTQAADVVNAMVSLDGAIGAVTAIGGDADTDDRWHFAVATYDGMRLCLYVDGVLNSTMSITGQIFDGTSPFDIGAVGADAATAGTFPLYGRVDEAFLTGDILSEDQIRVLMAAKIPHEIGSAPKRVSLMVRRLKKGPVLAQTDFTALGLAAPLRIYNLDDANDDGTAGLTLGTGGGGNVAGDSPGPAGSVGKAAYFDGVNDYFQIQDTNLPAGTTARTILAWFRTLDNLNRVIVTYGANVAGQYVRLETVVSGSIIRLQVTDGTSALPGSWAIATGTWHRAAVVMDNAAVDGLKRKLYMDGKLVASDTTFNSTVLGGVNAFKIGSALSGGTLLFKGHIARVAVCNYAMTPAQLTQLWALGTQDLGPSPYPPGEYVERFDSSGLYVLGERGSLEDQEQVEIEVGV